MNKKNTKKISGKVSKTTANAVSDVDLKDVVEVIKRVKKIVGDLLK